jgi:prevent-host-death family protein
MLQTVAQLCYGFVMATPVSQRELRNDSGAIMRRVQQGERFTVTRNGVPVADLLPHNESGPERPSRFIPVAQITAGASALPSWDTARFSRELQELDNAVDDSETDRWRAT